MNTFEFVITIVSIVLVFSLFREIVRRRQGSAMTWDAWLEGSGLELESDRLDALERRVEVLERIATNKKRKLAEEIDAL